MTIKECIDIVDSSKPNQYTIKDKVIWLSFVEGIIIDEVLKTHEGYDGRYDLFNGYTEDDMTVALIVPSPYDRLYTAYLKMKIDQENGETARYNNSMMMYNSYMLEWRKHYNKTHMPIDVTSKARSMMPPKTSSAGLSEAEFESLKRELTYIMTQYFGDSVSEDKIYEAVYNYVQNNIELLKGRNGYTPIKGVDYWTDADIAEFTEAMRAVLADEVRAREDADEKISLKLDKKVDKEEGKGLSVVDAYPLYRIIGDKEYMCGINFVYQEGFSSIEYFYTVPEIDEKLAEKASISDVVEVEAIAKGRATGYVFDTYDDMTTWLADSTNTEKLNLGDNLYIRATNVPDYWWDGSSAQHLETQKVDLTEYVKKEDGYGLSGTRDVYTMSYEGEADDENYIELYIESQYGDEIISVLYEKPVINNLLDKKQNKPTRENWQNEPSIEDGVYLLILMDNTELKAVSNVLDLTINANYFPLLSEMYVAFTSGDELLITDNAHIAKWIGDDCNSNGVFTPAPNTSYEISFKNTISGIIARVGAC